MKKRLKSLRFLLLAFGILFLFVLRVNHNRLPSTPNVEEYDFSAIEEYSDIAADGLKDILQNLFGYDAKVSTGATPDDFDNELCPATVQKVVDGDTLYVTLENGEQLKVRMIGIDTPESVHSDKSKNNEYGEMASQYTKELLPVGTNVYLEYDKESKDSYNRTLAYVWLSDVANMTEIESIKSNMVNGILLANGYAMDKVYKPNVKYATYFEEIRTEAEKNSIGLWQYEEFQHLWNQN